MILVLHKLRMNYGFVFGLNHCHRPRKAYKNLINVIFCHFSQHFRFSLSFPSVFDVRMIHLCISSFFLNFVQLFAETAICMQNIVLCPTTPQYNKLGKILNFLSEKRPYTLITVNSGLFMGRVTDTSCLRPSPC